MILIENKKIAYDYEILDKYTAGLVLFGWEVKSLRAKKANIKSSWVSFHNDEMFLQNFSISMWPFGQENCDMKREKKILLKKKEIIKLATKSKEMKGTIVPIKIFTQGKNIKCEIALVRGKKKYEKRETIKKRDELRKINKFYRV